MTVSTFYPDGDPETTSVDGDLQNSNGGPDTTFALLRDRTTSDTSFESDPTARPRVASGGLTNEWNIFSRAFLLFDTSSLPDTDTIESATMDIVLTAKTDNFTEAGSMSMVTSSPASNTAIVLTDYDNFGTTKQATDRTIAGLTADSATYQSFTLNATGLTNVSNTGISKYGIRSTFDNDNTPPTWGGDLFSAITFATAEEILAGDKRPKLVVTHVAAASGKFFAVF